MPPPPDDSHRRRRRERIRRRTTKLDGFFAFSDPAEAAADGPMMSRSDAERKASELLVTLPALPAIVLEASRPAGPKTSSLENAIDIDPHLASLTLAVGGSVFFRRGGDKPNNMAQLIDRVGTAAFRNITLVAYFNKLFGMALPWYGLGPSGLWWHLVGTGVAAREIAESVGLNRLAAEVTVLASLFHDVGKPTIQGLVGKDAPPPYRSTGDQLTVLEAEVRTVALTHPELVPLMLDIWGIEHSIFHIAEHHHAPQRAVKLERQTAIVQLADMLANRSQLGLDNAYGFTTPPLERVAEKAGISPVDAVAIQGELSFAVADIANQIAAVRE
jgi:HD-like signal output (HDOD) protein